MKESQLRGSDRTIRNDRTGKRGKGAEILPADGQDDGGSDREISKWDIFYYVYGLLHHPGYREKYADNLKRELPRIPFAPDFWAFAESGKKLAALHLDYEKIAVTMPEDETPSTRKKKGGHAAGGHAGPPLQWLINEDAALSYRIEKMRLSKDKTELKLNESLTLAGIPAEALEYRLGNRSALEWVIDQYQVKEDKRSGIVSDPNREDDEEYIARLVRQVIEVSLQTVAIVQSLPAEFEAQSREEIPAG